jgi:hypothetical protein
VTARSVDTQGLIELQRLDPAQFEALAKSLIILDLPEHFMKQNQGLHRSNVVPARRQAAL